MAVSVLKVDQRVIDIDSRRFASIEKALVELITNSDDSYLRLEEKGETVVGDILIGYERHRNGAFLSVSDSAEGMSFERLKSVITYGGAFSGLSRGETGGRGYFGRGMKQAIYGLGHGWIESIKDGRFSRIDLYRADTGEYLFDDGDGDRDAKVSDYTRLNIPEGGNGTRVGIAVDNGGVSISLFHSLKESISKNIYIRDILGRRGIRIVNLNSLEKDRIEEKLEYAEPESDLLIGPDEIGSFSHDGENYDFKLTLKKALGAELTTRGEERTNGLLVLSGTAVLDCQFFEFENQMGTEYLFGTVECDGISKMLSSGRPVISDERDGLNMKEPFVVSFSKAVSELMVNAVKSEQLRLSHVDRAKTSQRTDSLIDALLEKMNKIAFEDLRIRIQEEGDREPLGFSTEFYYRKSGHNFHITLKVDREKVGRKEKISFNSELPDGLEISPKLESISASDIPKDGKIVFTLKGDSAGRGSIEAALGGYRTKCEIVLDHEASERGDSHSSRKTEWSGDEDISVFRGYELRNLGNDMERAVYDRSERLILINTEAPTVRMYVDGHGRFTDGARLLLAELLLDVITDEMAHRYIDRTGHGGREDSYRKAKQEMVRRYGVEIHSTLVGK